MVEIPRGLGPEGGIPRQPSLFERSQNELDLISRKEQVGNVDTNDFLRRGELLGDREGWGRNARRFGALNLADERLGGVLEAVFGEEPTSKPFDYISELARGGKLAQETEEDVWSERRFRNNPDFTRDTYHGMVEVYVTDALDDVRDTLRGDRPPEHEPWQWNMIDASVAQDAARPAVPEPTTATTIPDTETKRARPRVDAEPPLRRPTPDTPRDREETREEFERDVQRMSEEFNRRVAELSSSLEAAFRGHRSVEQFLVWESEEADPAIGRDFSRRWLRKHQVPDMVRAGITPEIFQDEHTSMVFSDVSDIGLGKDYILDRQLATIISTSHERGFRSAAFNGLIPLLALDGAMYTRRMDEKDMLAAVAAVSPNGLSRWLRQDDETRKCFVLLLQLQGYKVRGEANPDQLIPGLERVGTDPDHITMQSPYKLRSVEHLFSDVLGGRGTDREGGIEEDEIEEYLKAVQEAIGTDKGIVRVAYTAFRFFWFPHQNNKIKEMYGTIYDPITDKGFFEPTEVCSLLDRNKDLKRHPMTRADGSVVLDRKTNRPKMQSLTLKEVLEKKGIDEFLGALTSARTPTTQMSREWNDEKTRLDWKDSFTGIMKGRGPDGANTEIDQRGEELQESYAKNGAVLRLKGKVSDATLARTLNPFAIGTGLKEAHIGTGAKAVQGAKATAAGIGRAVATGAMSGNSLNRAVTDFLGLNRVTDSQEQRQKTQQKSGLRKFLGLNNRNEDQ